jgi:hypothetical protein
VETLLERDAEGDLAEAEEVIDRLANLSADEVSAMREITLLRLRALLAQARAEGVTYREYRDRYGATARSLGFEGHIGDRVTRDSLDDALVAQRQSDSRVSGNPCG